MIELVVWGNNIVKIFYYNFMKKNTGQITNKSKKKGLCCFVWVKRLSTKLTKLTQRAQRKR